MNVTCACVQAINDEVNTASYRNKTTKDLGTVRNLPVWQQEVTDEQGRKVRILMRVHGDVGQRTLMQPWVF